MDGPDLEDLVSGELGEIMGIKNAPEFVQVIRWVKAHPQYAVGHLDWLDEVRERSGRHPRLYLAGSSYKGVGVPDCIRQAKAAVEQLFNDIAGDKSIRSRQEVKSEIHAS
jgi:oxygen-dependent protoporphyrinogen oxidase